jgi:hypothetical protein
MKESAAMMATAKQQASAPTKTFRTATHTEPKKNRQTNKTINRTRARQQHSNICSLEKSEAFTQKQKKGNITADSFITTTFKSDDGQLGRNM